MSLESVPSATGTASLLVVVVVVVVVIFSNAAAVFALSLLLHTRRTQARTNSWHRTVCSAVCTSASQTRTAAPVATTHNTYIRPVATHACIGGTTLRGIDTQGVSAPPVKSRRTHFMTLESKRRTGAFASTTGLALLSAWALTPTRCSCCCCCCCGGRGDCKATAMAGLAVRLPVVPRRELALTMFPIKGERPPLTSAPSGLRRRAPLCDFPLPDPGVPSVAARKSSKVVAFSTSAFEYCKT